MIDLQKVLLIPDVHRPAHDKRAWRLMMQVAQDIKPKHIIVLGDLLDCFSISTYSKDISRYGGLEKEIEDGNKAMDELDALGATGKRIYLSGNHEWRLERYLLDKAPQLLGFVDIPSLLRLQQRGWVHVPYKQSYKLGKVWFTHDTGVSGKYAVQRNLEAYQHSVVAAHTHRLGYVVEGNAVGERRVSTTLGWLGDVNQVDYMYRVKANRDWALGFGLGYMQPSGVMHVQPVPIVNYRVVVEGRLYK